MSRLNLGWKLWQPFSEVNYVWMNRVSTMVAKLVFDGLASNLFGVTGTTGEHGSAQTGWIGDSCRASLSSGLVVSVAAGVGMADLVALTGATADQWTPSYVPMALLTATTVTHDAHDGSIRYDWVYATPGTTDTDSTSLRYREVSGGAASDTLAQATRWRATIAIQKGTAGAGVPTLSAGRVPIALVKIPATSGAITIYDARTLLRWGRAAAAIPDDGIGAPYCQPVIQDVAVSLPGGMVCNFSVWFDYAGSRRYLTGQTLTVSTAHGSLDRIDSVYLKKESAGHWTINIVAGTAAADPVAGTVPAGGVKVAEIDVPAGDTSIGALQIRASAGAVYPYTTDMVDDIAEQVIRARVTVLAQPTSGGLQDRREVEIDLYDRHGRRVRKAIPLMVSVYSLGADGIDSFPVEHNGAATDPKVYSSALTEGVLEEEGTGTGGPFVAIINTSANGRIRGLYLTETASDSNCLLCVEPMLYADASDDTDDVTAGGDDWIPGGPTRLRVHFSA